MSEQMSDFEIDTYIRLTAHELLIQQLYVQFANLTEDPEQTLSEAESALVKVISSIKPPAAGIEEKHIRLLMLQREHGPDLIQNFFRKARYNLPKR